MLVIDPLMDELSEPFLFSDIGGDMGRAGNGALGGPPGGAGRPSLGIGGKALEGGADRGGNAEPFDMMLPLLDDTVEIIEFRLLLSSFSSP